MTKRRLLLLLCLAAAAVTVAVAGSTAAAAPPGSYACTNGPITGTYNGNLVVTADCTFSDTVTINGNLTVAPGVLLNDHAGATATVTVHGNVLVGPGAVLGLGDYNPFGSHTSSVVDGNLIANQPLSLYLGDITVRGNLVSNGGGGADAAFRSFPIKDDAIGGNLIVQGWQGAWIGLVGNQVGGNVVFSNNSAAISKTDQKPDSSEVVGNHVGGNLICQHNDPAAQFGDAIPPNGFRGPNVVSGNAIGECAGLLTLPTG